MAPVTLRVALVLCLLPAAGDLPTVGWEKVAATARSHLARGDFEAARQSAGRGFDRWRDRKFSKWHWEFRLTLAESLLELSRLEEAKPLLQVVPPASPLLQGRRLLDLAYLNYRTRNFTAAGKYLDFAESLVAATPELAAKVHLIRGMAYLKQEQYREAEASFRLVTSSLSGSGSLLECYAFINLGHLFLLEFRYDEALALFERARAISVEIGVARAEALSTGNLGVVRFWLGDVNRALSLFMESAKICEQTHDRVYEQRWLALIGEVYESIREYTKAAEFYEKARRLARPGIDDDWLNSILSDLTDVALKLGDVTTAQRLNAEAQRLADGLHTIGSQVLPTLNTARIAMAQHRYALAEVQFLKAINLSRAAQDPINEWKAHSGLATLQLVSKHWREAGSEYRAAIDIIERERSKIRYDELKFTFLSSLIRFYQEYVDFLMDRGQTQRAFEVAASSRARVLSEKLHTSALTRTKAAARLHRLVANTQTILASYWLAPGRSFLWVIDESGLRAFILPPEEEIASKVSSWRKAVLESDSEDTPNEAGQWLNNHLISDHFTVPRNYTLVVAPDGSLFELNFEALPTGRNGGYWIDKTTIAVAPAPSLLRSLEHPKNDYLLLIGDPDFESAEFPRLAHLNKEMSDISSQFTKKDVYRGAAATPEAYRRAPTAHYSVVHFAAHAVASWDNPLDSAILLSGGVNHKLYARDITRYPLHAGLVTLSACQTAGKRTYAGEGLTGLAWAFLSAGAAQVVAGLWDVDDRATSSLMWRFYTSIQSGESPVRALRSAKLSLMRSSNMYRNPLYWAGFEVFTNGVYRGSPI